MEQLIVRLFLALFALEFLVEFGLNELNLRYVRARWNERKVPDFFQGKIDAGEYDKSVQYTLAKGKFQRWAEIYGRLVTLVVLFSGLLPFLDGLSKDLASRFFPVMQAQGIIFCFSVALIFTFASLPTDLYATFVRPDCVPPAAGLVSTRYFCAPRQPPPKQRGRRPAGADR